VYYFVEFGHSVQTVWEEVGNTKNFRDAMVPPIAMGAWPTPWKNAFTACYPTEFYRSKSNGTSIEILYKNLTLTASHVILPFKLPKSKIIGTDTDRSATSFQRSNLGLSYLFGDKRRSQCIFVPAEGAHIGIGT